MELSDLVADLCSDWRAGDNVMTWIRKHEGVEHKLSRLVREGWSWEDVGLALDLAGIRYQTGKPISGELLRRKAGRARSEERVRQLQHHQTDIVKSSSSASAPVAQAAKIEESPDDEQSIEPEFKPAVLIGWSGKTRADRQGPNQSKPASSSPPIDDVDTVLSRLLGKK